MLFVTGSSATLPTNADELAHESQSCVVPTFAVNQHDPEVSARATASSGVCDGGGEGPAGATLPINFAVDPHTGKIHRAKDDSAVLVWLAVGPVRQMKYRLEGKRVGNAGIFKSDGVHGGRCVYLTGPRGCSVLNPYMNTVQDPARVTLTEVSVGVCPRCARARLTVPRVSISFGRMSCIRQGLVMCVD